MELKTQNVEIGMLGFIDVKNKIKSRELKEEEIISYYKKHYAEDIKWFESELANTITKYCNTTGSKDGEFDIEKSKEFSQFIKDGKEYLGNDTFMIIYDLMYKDVVKILTIIECPNAANKSKKNRGVKH